MAKIFKVSGKLSVDTTDFTTKINGVSKTVSKACRGAAKSFSGLSKNLTSIGKDMMILGGGLALGLVKSFKSLVAGGKELSEISKQLNISTDAAKKLQFAAQMGGLEFQDMSASISKMQRTLGSSKGDAALKSLGLDPKTIKSMTSDKAFIQIIDSIAKIGDTNKRTSVTMDLFGKSGFKMLRFVKDGKSQLNEFLAKAEEMGISFSEEKAKRFEQFAQRMIQLKVAVKSLGNMIIMELEPYIQSWYEKLLKLTVTVSKFVKEHKGLVTSIAKGVLAFAFLNAILGVAAFAFGRLFNTTAKVIKASKTMFDWISKITAAKKVETAAEVANTVAVEANTVAKAANGKVGLGGGIGGVLGKAGLVAGTAVAAYAGTRWVMEKTGADKYVQNGFMAFMDHGQNSEKALGERTRQMMAEGKLKNLDVTPAKTQPDKQMDENNRLMREQNELMKRLVNQNQGASGLSKMPVPAF